MLPGFEEGVILPFELKVIMDNPLWNRLPAEVRLHVDGLIRGGLKMRFISEFSPSGQLLFDAELPVGVTSYRAYRRPWHPAG